MKPNRRKVLECMVWAGAGVLWTVRGGVPRSGLIGSASAATESGGLSFVQISDSHLGFGNAPNPDTAGTLTAAIALVGTLKKDAGLMIHTGDVSHLSKDAQFDTAEKIIAGARLETHYVPGEHDVLVDDGKGFFSRFTKAGPRGWYSFDQQGVHFIGLNNVQDLKAGGMGNLGADQLAWLRDDLNGRSASQPIVVFAHVPLWTVYAEWGWGTDDGAQALALLKRFGSVTVLNGHIHQVMQKVEGNLAFPHRAVDRVSAAGARHCAVAGPDEGCAAGKIAGDAGCRTGDRDRGFRAVGDHRHAARRLDPRRCLVFRFCRFSGYCWSAARRRRRRSSRRSTILPSPRRRSWCRVAPRSPGPIAMTFRTPSRGRMRHGCFSRRRLDTDDHYSYRFETAGRFTYFCSLHSHMTAVVVVR